MDPLLYIPALVFAGLTGLAVGSFLNVVIHRVPRGESIVSPGSHCPGCDRPIRWYENVPVVSWLALRGRCAGCDSPIAARYTMVELLGGLSGVVPLLVYGMTWPAVAGMVMGWHLIALGVIDLETRLVPDSIVISLGLFGVLLVGLGQGFDGLGMGLLAGAILAGFFWLLRTLASVAMGREAMGSGDITMSAAIGIYLTPLHLPLFLLLASVSVLLASLLWAWVRKTGLRDVEIPFGPGLALGGWLTYLVGEPLFREMLHLADLIA